MQEGEKTFTGPAYFISSPDPGLLKCGGFDEVFLKYPFATTACPKPQPKL